MKLLLEILRDENEKVRWRAAEDLGYLGNRNQADEKIIGEALSYVEYNINKEAIHALEKMTAEKEREALYAEIWEA